MKKLFVTLAVVLLAITGVALCDEKTVTTDGGTVTADVTYTVDKKAPSKDEWNEDHPDDKIDEQNKYSADGVKAAIKAKVAYTVTAGKVNLEYGAYTFDEASGQWKAGSVDFAKTNGKVAGKAKFDVTNYSYKNVEAKVEFDPVTTVADDVDDKELTVNSTFDANFGTSVFTLPSTYNTETTGDLEVKFATAFTAAMAESDTAKKMGTFTVTITAVNR